MTVALIWMFFALLVTSNGRTVIKQNPDALESVFGALAHKQRLTGEAASFDQRMRPKRKNERPLIMPNANDLTLEQSAKYEPPEKEIEHSSQNGSSRREEYMKKTKHAETGWFEEHKTPPRAYEMPQGKLKQVDVAEKAGEKNYGKSMVESSLAHHRVLDSKQRTVYYFPDNNRKRKLKPAKNGEDKELDMLDKLDDIMTKVGGL